MQTKHWIALLCGVFVLCLALIWRFWPSEEASLVEVYSEGELLYSLRLDVDQTVEVTSRYGTNTVTIKDGKVAVTQADCPDHYCMDRGWCDSGAQIVCLPNRLVLQFVGKQTIDGAVG